MSELRADYRRECKLIPKGGIDRPQGGFLDDIESRHVTLNKKKGTSIDKVYVYHADVSIFTRYQKNTAIYNKSPCIYLGQNPSEAEIQDMVMTVDKVCNRESKLFYEYHTYQYHYWFYFQPTPHVVVVYISDFSPSFSLLVFTLCCLFKIDL